MKNPVLTPSGNYYEKSAIIDWLKTHNNDPLSREFLSVDMLVEDHDFKQNFHLKFIYINFIYIICIYLNNCKIFIIFII